MGEKAKRPSSNSTIFFPPASSTAGVVRDTTVTGDVVAQVLAAASAAVADGSFCFYIGTGDKLRMTPSSAGEPFAWTGRVGCWARSCC